MQMILTDSRQQTGKHNAKEKYFLEHGIITNRTALYCGDYTLPTDQSICIDTKKDLAELIGDIQTKTMPKKEIEQRVFDICKAAYISFDLAEEVYHSICDDDTDRFPEKEIRDFCVKHNATGYISIVKIMEQTGQASRCAKEFYEHDNVSGSEKQLILNEYCTDHKGQFYISCAKSSIEDAFQDLYVKRHGFFHRGLKRAQNSGIHDIILVENTDCITRVEDLFHWINPRLKVWKNSNQVIGYWNNGRPRYKKVQAYPNAMSGEILAKACLTMQLKYGCEFQFCRPDESGKRILELLGVN